MHDRFCDIKYTFSFGLGLLRAKLSKKRVPFQAFIRLLDDCNQNCCYCSGDYSRLGNSLSTEQALLLIRDLKRSGTKRVTLFGGEPLLRDDIGLIIDEVKSCGMHCSLTTNGILIKKRMAEIKKLDQLSVSLDGGEDSHDRCRGAGTWQQAMNAIKCARASDVPVQIICTISKYTDPCLKELTQIADKYKCWLDLEFIRPVFKEDKSLMLRDEDIGQKGYDNFLRMHMKAGPAFAVDKNILKALLEWPDYKKFKIEDKGLLRCKNMHKCYAGIYYCLIESNGDLYPCCVPMPEYSPVNVFDLGFESAWAKMPQKKCIACRSLGFNVFNAIFALDRRLIMKVLRALSVSKKGKGNI